MSETVNAVVAGLKAKLKDISPQVIEELTALRVKKAIDRRVAVLDKAFQELDQMQKDWYRLTSKGDTPLNDAQGNMIMDGFSPAHTKEIKDLEEKREKLTGAIDQAIGTKEDYSKLFDRFKGVGE